MSEYGVLAPIVVHAGSAIAATGAISLGFKGRWNWDPCEEDVSNGPRKVAGLLAALAIGIMWATLQQPANTYALIVIIFACGSSTLLSLMVYGFLINVYTFDRCKIVNGVETHENVIGGFTLSEEAKHNRDNFKEEKGVFLTVQELLKGAEYNVDKIWTRVSRGLAKQLFVLSYIILVGCGTTALAATAILIGLQIKP